MIARFYARTVVGTDAVAWDLFFAAAAPCFVEFWALPFAFSAMMALGALGVMSMTLALALAKAVAGGLAVVDSASD